MRPAPFDLVAPSTLHDAVAELGDGDDTRPLAGGQSLIGLMNLRLATPTKLVDLARVRELAALEDLGDRVRIGAMARQADVERDELIVGHTPLIAEALGHVGHWQIRTRGTIGGNLAHADPASELPAVMLVLDARFRAHSTRGARLIPASEFMTGAYTTDLASDELLTAIEVPKQRASEHTAIVEIARVAGAFALAGAVVWCRIEHGQCSETRIAVFGTGSHQTRVAAAETMVAGTELDDRSIDDAAAATAASVPAHGDVHVTARQRQRLLGVVVARALKAARERAGALV